MSSEALGVIMITITCAGSSACVEPVTRQEVECVHRFIESQLYYYSYVKLVKGRPKLEAIYALETRSAIWIHVNMVPELTTLLNQVHYPFTIVKKDCATGRSVDYQALPHITPRDYQEKAIEHLMMYPSSTNGLGLTPGAGKTITYLLYLAKHKGFCAGIMKPTYLTQWYKVIPTVLNIPKERIWMEHGKTGITQLMKYAESGDEFPYDFILLSTNTVQRWVTHKGNVYPYTIRELFEKLGVLNVLIDEVHEFLHFNYLLMCSVSVWRVTGLSGTFFNRDKFISKIQNCMIPADALYDVLARNPYISYVEMGYMLGWNLKPQTAHRGMSSYNQIAYEHWMLKQHALIRDFIHTIHKLIQRTYLERKREGDRILIYAASVDMVNVLAEAMEILLPLEIKIAAHTGDSKYETLLENDVIIATPNKAGTAVDIPGLITVISGHMTASLQKVVQMLGRLREIPGMETIYVQLVCKDIEKHQVYQRGNRFVLDARVKDYRTLIMKKSLT